MEITGAMEEKGWKVGIEGIKLKLGFWIGDVKIASDGTTFPPMDDMT